MNCSLMDFVLQKCGPAAIMRLGYPSPWDRLGSYSIVHSLVTSSFYSAIRHKRIIHVGPRSFHPRILEQADMTWSFPSRKA